jgi:hypothetical protein
LNLLLGWVHYSEHGPVAMAVDNKGEVAVGEELGPGHRKQCAWPYLAMLWMCVSVAPTVMARCEVSSAAARPGSEAWP